ncbi:MAG TPA: hypothetical protein VLS90_11460, partial [Thermodesulfobacteriota bacterium]|nr:hypothetical protein [Thermodesulfobacteriota bacterium]
MRIIFGTWMRTLFCGALLFTSVGCAGAPPKKAAAVKSPPAQAAADKKMQEAKTPPAQAVPRAEASPTMPPQAPPAQQPPKPGAPPMPPAPPSSQPAAPGFSAPPQGLTPPPPPQPQASAPFPPPPPGASPLLPPGAQRPGSRFVLNFDNADIFEVIRVMAEMMNINYVVDPRVKGVVNIRTTGQISTPDIFPIFQSILKMNGATAVKKGIVYEIVPFGDAKKGQSAPQSGRTPGDGGNPEERYTIQIISLKYIPATEVTKMIKPFLTDGADIVEHAQYNTIILGDMYSNVQKVLDLVELFDVDIFADMRVRIYPVSNAYAEDVAKEMERIFSSLEVSTKSGRGVG